MKMFRLGEVVTIARGTTYKSALKGLPGPILLGLGSINRNGGFRNENLETYGGDSPSKMLVQPGELYASLKDVTQSADLLGAVARLPKSGPAGRLTQDTVRLDFVSDQVPSEYLYWILRTPEYRSFCRSHLTGTTNLGLPRADFLAFQFPAPDPDRLSIAATLDALEEKIESNRRLVPVVLGLIRARIESSLSYGLEEWPVSSLASFVNGGAFTKGASGVGRMVLRIAELNKGPGPSTVYNDIDVPQEKLARPGDILMSWSGSLGLYRWTLAEAIINQHIFKVIPKELPSWLVFDRVDSAMPVFQALAADRATTMGHIQRNQLDTTTVQLPVATCIREMHEEMTALWDRLLIAEREIHILEDTRQAFLRVLLSGRSTSGEFSE